MQLRLARTRAIRHPEGSQRFTKSDDERAMAVCEGMIDIAAALFDIPSKELRRPGRATREIVRIRQIAMYVSHVALAISQGEVGRGFGRDRTTVLHACRIVEDMRDDREFDSIVAVTERVALAVFGQEGEQ